MARSTSTNYTSPSFTLASAGGDDFLGTDVRQLAAALDAHDHSAGKGLTVSGGGGTPTTIPSCAVYKNAAQSIAEGVSTVVTFNQEWWDTDTIHDNATNNSRLTCKTAGKYLISFNYEFAANGTGDRITFVHLNGALIGGIMSVSATATVTSAGYGTFVWPLVVNDYIEFLVHQNSGGALNITTNTQFQMTWLGL